MTRLVRAELAKMTTTRAVYLLFAGVAALAIISVVDPERSADAFDRPFHEQTFLFITSLLSRILILVMGIRTITDEMRHGTIVSTLTSAPRRARLIAAKAVVAGGAGALLAVCAWTVMTGAAATLAAIDGSELRLGATAWRSLAGTTLAGASWALVGLGLGAIVRSQVVAIVAGLVWLMGVEDAVRDWFGDLAVYLPGQAGLALAISPSQRGAVLGAATMVAYAVAASVAGAVAMRRDVA